MRQMWYTISVQSIRTYKLQFIGLFLRRRRNRFPLGGSWHKIGASEPIL